MSLVIKWVSARKTERFSLLLAGTILCLLFWKLFSVIQRDFADVDNRLQNGTMINLNSGKLSGNMRLLLQNGMYFEDSKDISFISANLNKQDDIGTIDNVGELNKKKFYVNGEEAFLNGGRSFKKRVLLSRNLLGFAEADSVTFEKEKVTPLKVGSNTNVQLGSLVISGVIKNQSGQPVKSALVRLKQLVAEDSLNANGDESMVQFRDGIRKILVTDSSGELQLLSFNAYARTDVNGSYSFIGLPADKSYEVLPLQPGFEFGKTKGIVKLDRNVAFDFVQSPHLLRLFSAKDFATFKKEKAFIVRTPEEVTNWFRNIVIGFFACFIILHILLTIRFPHADQLLLPVIMILTGLSFIALFSLQDPLRDRFLAKATFIYFLVGIAIIILLQYMNLKKFTPDSGFFRIFLFKNKPYAANGWPWAAGAMALLGLTILFGTGPEGSGVKVNLFGFQPSEIVKYMIILFLAGFFNANEKFIADYPSFGKRLSFFISALIAIVSSILLFLVLGDLGPAIVCCFTFIILFSFSRGDFMPMVAALILYALSAWICNNLWMATGITAIVLLVYMFIAKKKVSESTIMALVVVSSFLLLDKVQVLAKIIPGPVQRLVDRKAIWSNAWDNQVYGGDQVANGIWAISTGGITGQGAGEGFGKTIPEAHTDMILPAIGEELGWTGITCIFILFLLLLHRSIIIGRQAGAPFLFYVCAGAGIGIFIQFLLIAGGSTGALPLSGVALPFTSYGGTSLLCCMTAAGFLLSVSRLTGTPVQMKYITQRQDKNLMPAMLAACAAIILLAVNVSSYTFQEKKWLTEPALVADRNGVRMFSYNPRINILMNRLQAGNIYDRNGRLLATSNAGLVQVQKDSLITLGIPPENITSLSYKRQERYYPFGEHMFFWTGDANTGVFSGGSNGYFAEYAHVAELRGFPAPVIKYQVSANRYKAEKFLPASETEMMVVKRDYSALTGMLSAGINSDEVAAFKKKNRDVTLTIDAALQTKIERSIQSDDSVNSKRVSVVVMEDKTGDVLASACWPLPPVNDFERLSLSGSELNKLPGWNVNADMGFTHATQPGSTAKLVTAMAAFNKLGIAAAKKNIRVYPRDLIRVTGPEPDEAGLINIEKAIVKSNNSFFIRLANEEQLQEQMVDLYMQAGMFLHGVGGYYFDNETNTAQAEKWRTLWRETEFKSLKRYNPDNIKRTRAIGISGMSWGQGELVATPAAVARIAAGIANNGVMIPNRYAININGNPVNVKGGIRIAKDSTYARYVQTYMREQSAPKKGKLGIFVAGKTGTPERIFKGESINDGWYVFFTPVANGDGHIVVCIRIEGAKGSSEAVKLAGKHVIPVLLQQQYIKSFEQLPKKEKAMLAQSNLN